MLDKSKKAQIHLKEINADYPFLFRMIEPCSFWKNPDDVELGRALRKPARADRQLDLRNPDKHVTSGCRLVEK